MSKHTPTPWEVDEANPGLVFTGYDVDPDGARQYICQCPPEGTTDADTTPQTEVKANAAFIVTACNSHDALVGALKLAQVTLRDVADHVSNDVENRCCVPETEKAIAAAIALARKVE